MKMLLTVLAVTVASMAAGVAFAWFLAKMEVE